MIFKKEQTIEKVNLSDDAFFESIELNLIKNLKSKPWSRPLTTNHTNTLDKRILSACLALP